MTGARIGRVVLVGCGLLAALAYPVAASAKHGLVTGVEDGGVFGIATDPAERTTWLDRTVEARIGIVRRSVNWGAIAGLERPSDPTNPGSASYYFRSADVAVRAVEARGLAVVLTVGPHTPAWAEAPGRPASIRPGRWKPANPSDLADFVQAVAARYSGSFDPDGFGPEPPLPAVQAVEIWNEPNGEPWISPQYGGTPDYYRTMLNESYRSAKAVNPGMLVVTGGTSPYGDPPGGPYPADGGRVRPVEFWQRVLCVHPVRSKKRKKGKKRSGFSPGRFVRTEGCDAPALFDVFAHHPIDNTGGGPLQSGPHRNDASTPDLGRVVRVLRAAERVGTVLPGRHPVWATEFWWDSKPPNSLGAPLGVQARWIEQSLYLFWKAGASVAINFQLRDKSGSEYERAGHQSGLFFANGQPKPAYTAFRFPFVTERVDKRAVRAWGKAPVGGKLVIERRAEARWVTTKTIKVGQGAVFVTKLRLSGKQRLRARVAGDRSLVWKHG